MSTGRVELALLPTARSLPHQRHTLSVTYIGIFPNIFLLSPSFFPLHHQSPWKSEPLGYSLFYPKITFTAKDMVLSRKTGMKQVNCFYQMIRRLENRLVTLRPISNRRQGCDFRQSGSPRRKYGSASETCWTMLDEYRSRRGSGRSGRKYLVSRLDRYLRLRGSTCKATRRLWTRTTRWTLTVRWRQERSNATFAALQNFWAISLVISSLAKKRSLKAASLLLSNRPYRTFPVSPPSHQPSLPDQGWISSTRI